MPSQHETLLCHYRYDAMDRLIGSELTKQTELQRFYCKSRLATEVQGTLQRSIFQQGDQLLAQQQHQDGMIDTTLLVTDQQRSVLHTLRENSPRQAIAYSPYGHRSAESGLTSLLGFNGERPDPVTGHYLLGNGYRAFNPVSMRFNSPDSLSPFDKGGLNPYAYCLGDPVNLSDKTGHIPVGKTLSKMFDIPSWGINKLAGKPIGFTEFHNTERYRKLNNKIVELNRREQNRAFINEYRTLNETLPSRTNATGAREIPSTNKYQPIEHTHADYQYYYTAIKKMDFFDTIATRDRKGNLSGYTLSFNDPTLDLEAKYGGNYTQFVERMNKISDPNTGPLIIERDRIRAKYNVRK